MQAKVLIRLPKDFVLPKGWEPSEIEVIDPEPGSPAVVKEERFHDGSVLFATSYGRILFNSTLPVDYPFVNDQAPKKRLSKIDPSRCDQRSANQHRASFHPRQALFRRGTPTLPSCFGQKLQDPPQSRSYRSYPYPSSFDCRHLICLDIPYRSQSCCSRSHINGTQQPSQTGTGDPIAVENHQRN